MKKLLSIMMLLTLVACGGGGGVPTTIGGNNTGNGCTIEPVANLGVNITCDGETVFVPNGAKGDKGETGDTGNNGVNGQDGTNGNAGTDGIDGADGLDGGDNVYSKALALYNSHRSAIVRIAVTCEFNIDSDSGYGDPFVLTTVDGVSTSMTSYVSHTGSGFITDEDHIVSNIHVAGDSACDLGNGWGARVKSLQFKRRRGSNDEASATWSVTRNEFTTSESSTHDLIKITPNVLFWQNITGLTPLSVALPSEFSISTLRPTLSMSYPLGMTNLMTNIGTISSDVYVASSKYDFMTSNDTDSGSSGSPIIDIYTGKVIGIVTAGLADVNMNPSICISADRLNDF